MRSLATNPKCSGAVFSQQIIPTERPFGAVAALANKKEAIRAACHVAGTIPTTAAVTALSIALFEQAPTLPFKEQSIVNRQFASFPSYMPQMSVMVALNEMEEYRRLEDGWDGYGSIKPTLAAIEDAQLFYQTLPFGVTAPEATVSADGTVGWYWKAPSKYVAVQFSGNRKYAYYGDVVGHQIRGFYDLADGRVLPDDLLQILKIV